MIINLLCLLLKAGAFKRAARLSLASLRRWTSTNGYVYVVKNKMDPRDRWGYETYSHLTNYNGLPASMLALACICFFLFIVNYCSLLYYLTWIVQIADDTIPEGPTFSETGGKDNNNIL